MGSICSLTLIGNVFVECSNGGKMCFVWMTSHWDTLYVPMTCLHPCSYPIYLSKSNFPKIVDLLVILKHFSNNNNAENSRL